MSPPPDIAPARPPAPMLSVIIGIRDWERARLRMAVLSHLGCEIADQIEVVISDYGSRNHEEIRSLAEEMGCVYVYTDSEIWSRSRALNTGIVASRGTYIVATDADIVFSPKTHGIVVDLLRRYPHALHLKQCRDLPPEIGLEDLEVADWDHLDRIAQTRPRWGMGGLAACSRATVDRVRGYDERMVVWGAEDNDFGKRVRATGGALNWIADKDAQIYHVWHPPFLQTHPNAREIFTQNREYLLNDPSVIRNLAPGCVYRGVEPMISVIAVASARTVRLKAAVESVLRQSFEELELIVVDDGAADEARTMLAGIDDPRLRLVRNDLTRGEAFARNVGVSLARGRYVAVHDGDDVMTPTRLEAQLGCIAEGSRGAYGGWAGFGAADGALETFPGATPFSLGAVCFGTDAVSHATLLVERSLAQRLPYHERSDEGAGADAAMRFAWHGVKLNHCGSYAALRRMDETGPASTSRRAEQAAARAALLAGLSDDAVGALERAARQARPASMPPSDDLRRAAAAALPDEARIWLAARAITSLDPYLIPKDGAEPHVLVECRFENGEFRPVRELREGSPADGAPHIRKRLTLAPAGSKDANRDGGADLADDVVGAGLRLGASWIVLHCPGDARLLDALALARPLLPLKEDVFCFAASGAWRLAFAAGGEARELILRRKASHLDRRIEFLTMS